MIGLPPVIAERKAIRSVRRATQIIRSVYFDVNVGMPARLVLCADMIRFESHQAAQQNDLFRQAVAHGLAVQHRPFQKKRPVGPVPIAFVKKRIVVIHVCLRNVLIYRLIDLRFAHIGSDDPGKYVDRSRKKGV